MRQLFTHSLVTFCAAWISGCGFSVWPDRETQIVASLPTETLDFYPGPRRFVESGDSISLRFVGMHVGYACTRITQVTLAVDSQAMRADTLRVRPEIRAEIPGAPTCALQKTRDTLATVALNAKAGMTLVLADMGLVSGPKALLVAGQFHRDSLKHAKNDLGFTSRGVMTYRDSSAIFPQAKIFIDSLSACSILNYAWAKRNGDTVGVDLGWVTIDTAQAHGSFQCDTAAFRLDSLPVFFLGSP